jgi:hypothetical protein
MQAGPAVIVNGLDDAVAALQAARGTPVTLLSAPAAALFAGCLWWQQVVAQALTAVPNGNATDLLDCADASGIALSALRIGLRRIVLYPASPGREAVLAIAEACGALVLPAPPPALDLARRGAARRLQAWLHGDTDGAVG